MRQTEGLKMARLLMVMSSFAPLFILWAIRGTKLIPDHVLFPACFVLAFAPIGFLLIRVYVAKAEQDRQIVVTGASTDERGHLLGYLFAILLPLYQDRLDDVRSMIATIVALVLIIILFWRLNLHYMNLVFLAFDYRIYSVSPPEDSNPYSGQDRFILITHRTRLESGERLQGYRISNKIYLEVKP